MTTRPPGKQSKGLRDLDDIDAVFGALANASRRHILQVLWGRGSLTAGELSARFSHAWPTTTRHLRVLLDAGLITVTPAGRERHYQIASQRLGDVVGLWMGSVGFDVVPTTTQRVQRATRRKTDTTPAKRPASGDSAVGSGPAVGPHRSRSPLLR